MLVRAGVRSVRADRSASIVERRLALVIGRAREAACPRVGYEQALVVGRRSAPSSAEATAPRDPWALCACVGARGAEGARRVRFHA
jgi:hypothetical protein